MMFGQIPWPEGTFDTGYAPEGIKVTDEKTVAGFNALHDLVYVDKVAPEPAAAAAQASAPAVPPRPRPAPTAAPVQPRRTVVFEDDLDVPDFLK